MPAAEAERFVVAVAAAAVGRFGALSALSGVDVPERDGLAGRLEVVLSALEALRRSLTALDRAGSNGSAFDPSGTAAVFAAVGRGLTARALAEVVTAAPAAAPPAHDAGDPFGTTPIGVTLHELRRPLTIVSSYGQLLAAGTLGELPDRAATAVNALCGATETMLRLVQALSAVNRLEDPAELPAFRELEVAALVGAALEEVATEIQLGAVQLVVELEDGLRVRGDDEWLVVALTNLIENAVKHSPNGASVEIRARRDVGTVRITVRDHGPGFPARDTDRLFDKYFRSAAERDRGIAGTGLGLFIVRTVADRHRGEVSASLPESGGAQFELAIPLA
ncbi:MAG TPA: HAMP domain-containing sensor histidine kinase [Candidatus Dormibacteraeota bacterium]|nr:HAMP domain-containing sensor histidine kinase [Candidatus Dormibacteraeota bacterium]